MSNVVSGAFRRFTVHVIHDPESGMWVADCDELHLATEAPTFEALTARVWEIAPEMAEENSLGVQASNIHLLFEYEQAAPQSLAL